MDNTFDGLINSDVFQRAQGFRYAIVDTVAFGMRKVNNEPPFISLAFWNSPKSTDVELRDCVWGKMGQPRAPWPALRRYNH